jgi:glycosyltransferase involved in cell wall biosynthesis
MSDSGKIKTVALINPLWIGHHPVFFGYFAASFLRAGARVIGLSPNPDGARKEIEAAVGDFPDWEKRITLAMLPTGGRSWFNGRFEGDPYHTFQRWHLAGKTLRKTEAESRWTADLVYFPYIDSFIRFLPFSAVPDITIGRPWSGLYLRNHHHRSADEAACSPFHMLAKGDALIRTPLCREIGVLDERFVGGMKDYLGKPVIHYPDITRTHLPEEQPELTKSILQKASGRKIIGLIGLETRKGTINMLRVALKAHELRRPWYFAFAGTFNPNAYPRSDLAFITDVLGKIAAGEIDNIHFDPEAERIPTEADFNSLFSSFDVAWAAFEGFQGSSGTLSKAAAFNIPCVATAGECIGHRLENFRAGLTIPEGSTEKAFVAIEHLLEGTNWNNEPLNPDFASFNDAHSIERFDQIIRELLAKY